MGESYSFISNSGWMVVLCGIVICFVMVQSALFLKSAWKRSEEIGISISDRKKIVKSSALFFDCPIPPDSDQLCHPDACTGTFLPMAEAQCHWFCNV